MTPEGACLVQFEPGASDAELAQLRDGLWPLLHAIAIYSVKAGQVRRRSLSGDAELGPAELPDGRFLALRRRSLVLSPAATTEKFDANASGWNGEPGSPGWPHHRWMRRYTGTFDKHPGAKRILDFGCGAGWCGIEAAALHPGASLASFDPSPEMVRHTEQNATAAGIQDFTGRVGFGEDPPFPAEGEAPYELVISSGVVSFSPDYERWMQGLTAGVAPGGTLVVGDINNQSGGMRRRRRERPLLPVRELNGVGPDQVERWLVDAGYTRLKRAGYQLSWPIPQAMFVNETKLKGAISHPLVWLNAAGAGLSGMLKGGFGGAFDSWVMSFRAPR